MVKEPTVRINEERGPAPSSGPGPVAGRRSKRIAAEGVVKLFFDPRAVFRSGYLANLSAGGMFVKFMDPRPAGTRFHFDCRVGDRGRRLQGLAEVVWSRQTYLGPGKPPGMGARFVSLGPVSRLELGRLLGQDQAPGGGEVFPGGEGAVGERGEGSDVVTAPPPLPPDGAAADWRESVSGWEPTRDGQPVWSFLAALRLRWWWLAVLLAGAAVSYLSLRGGPSGGGAAPGSDPAAAAARGGSGGRRFLAETAAAVGESRVSAVVQEGDNERPTEASPLVLRGEVGEELAPSPRQRFTRVEEILWSVAGEATVVTIVTDGAIEPADYRHSTMGGDAPRELFVLKGVEGPFAPGPVEVSSPHLLRIRTGYHPPGDLHIVLDLPPSGRGVNSLEVADGTLTVRLGGND